MKAGAAPKAKSNPKPDAFAAPDGKPKAKAVWKKEKPDAPRGDAKPAADKPYKARAADPSKRFVPPNKLGQAGGKPKGGKPAGKPKGGEAAPKRPKSSFRPK
jgi:ATP-dependent RNA helicase DeaD